LIEVLANHHWKKFPIKLGHVPKIYKIRIKGRQNKKHAGTTVRKPSRKGGKKGVHSAKKGGGRTTFSSVSGGEGIACDYGIALGHQSDGQVKIMQTTPEKIKTRRERV